MSGKTSATRSKELELHQHRDNGSISGPLHDESRCLDRSLFQKHDRRAPGDDEAVPPKPRCNSMPSRSSATKAALRAMQLDLGTPRDEDHFPKTLVRSPPVSCECSCPSSPIHLQDDENSEGETDIFTPSSLCERHYILFYPSTAPYDRSYNHIQPLRICTEGPLQLVENKKSGERFIIKTIEECPEGVVPREAEVLLGSLKPHRNVVTLKECFWENDNYHMVLEYCSAGDLENLCNFYDDMKIRVPSEFILHFIAEMITVLGYMHEGVVGYLPDAGGPGEDVIEVREGHEMVIHRDIKPGNIFLRWDVSSSEYQMPTVVLGDFGRSCTEANNRYAYGTTGFAAPEVEAAWKRVEEGDDYDASKPVCSKASDMYSFGATLYNIIALEHYDPSSGSDIEQAWKNSKAKDWHIVLSLLQGCLVEDPASRLKVDDLLSLPHKIKDHLREWYRQGGRMQGGIWPDPWWTDDRIEALEAENPSNPSLSHTEDDPLEELPLKSQPSVESNAATLANSGKDCSIDMEIFNGFVRDLQDMEEVASSDGSTLESTTTDLISYDPVPEPDPERQLPGMEAYLEWKNDTSKRMTPDAPGYGRELVFNSKAEYIAWQRGSSNAATPGSIKPGSVSPPPEEFLCHTIREYQEWVRAQCEYEESQKQDGSGNRGTCGIL